MAKRIMFCLSGSMINSMSHYDRKRNLSTWITLTHHLVFVPIATAILLYILSDKVPFMDLS